MSSESILWTREGWGSSELPDNVDDVIYMANEFIKDYYESTQDEDMTRLFSEKLWENYCQTGTLKMPWLYDTDK